MYRLDPLGRAAALDGNAFSPRFRAASDPSPASDPPLGPERESLPMTILDPVTGLLIQIDTTGKERR